MRSFYFKFIKSCFIPVYFSILGCWSIVTGSNEVVSIQDDFLKKSHKVLVFLPQKYHHSDKRYPVIYLLHGYSGNYKTWSKIVPLKKYADSLQLIFVCPDGNYDSWYLDSPVKPDFKYESFIIKNLISYINKNYRVINGPEGRAICGSSMGGHGALTLLCKHTDLFCAASSISGILDLTLFPDNWNIKKVLGNMAENKQLWNEYSFVNTMKYMTESGRPLFIDCGSSDFALKANRDAHEKLENLKIAHEYYEGIGNHSPSYTKKRFTEHIRFLTGYLRAAY